MADEQVFGMHYFDHQFLRQEDFERAQNYHVDRLRQHNRLLHLPGIVEGLLVTGTINTRVVQVTLGRAVDETHHEVILRRTADPEVSPLLRVQTGTGFQESEQHITGTALTIDLTSVPASPPPDNAVFITVRQGTKETNRSQDPGTTDNNTRLVERAVIEASTSSPIGAQLLLAQINRNADGTIQNVDLTGRVFAGAWLADGSVTTNHIRNDAITLGKLDPELQSLIESGGAGDDGILSAMIADADGTSGQDTDTGRGVKTGHLQNNAVTSEKLQNNAVTNEKLQNNAVTNEKLRNNAVTNEKLQNNAVTNEKVADNTLFYTKLRGELFHIDVPLVANEDVMRQVGPADAFIFLSVNVLSSNRPNDFGAVTWTFRSRFEVHEGQAFLDVYVTNTAPHPITAVIRAFVLTEAS